MIVLQSCATGAAIEWSGDLKLAAGMSSPGGEETGEGELYSEFPPAWSFSGAWLLEGEAFFCHAPSSTFAPYVSGLRPLQSIFLQPCPTKSHLVKPSPTFWRKNMLCIPPQIHTLFNACSRLLAAINAYSSPLPPGGIFSGLRDPANLDTKRIVARFIFPATI